MDIPENSPADAAENVLPSLQRNYREVIATINQQNKKSLSLAQFVSQVVDIIHNHFNVYSVNLYSVEAEGKWAVLQAGTGEISQAALKGGHRLPIGGDSLVSAVIRSGKSHTAYVDKRPPVPFPSAVLPEVHSELVVPLVAQKEKIIGALDIQSTKFNVFDSGEVEVFAAIAKHTANILESTEWRE